MDQVYTPTVVYTSVRTRPRPGGCSTALQGPHRNDCQSLMGHTDIDRANTERTRSGRGAVLRIWVMRPHDVLPRPAQPLRVRPRGAAPGPSPTDTTRTGTVPRSVFLARHAGLRSGGMDRRLARPGFTVFPTMLGFLRVVAIREVRRRSSCVAESVSVVVWASVEPLGLWLPGGERCSLVRAAHPVGLVARPSACVAAGTTSLPDRYAAPSAWHWLSSYTYPSDQGDDW